jgi:hypothetical protein
LASKGRNKKSEDPFFVFCQRVGSECEFYIDVNLEEEFKGEEMAERPHGFGIKKRPFVFRNFF